MDLVPTGVDGLDEMLGGGLPRGHVVALLGSFGTGKTTFGLQFVMQGLINGEKGIFITLEEDVESILKTAEGYGWDLRAHVDDKTASLIKLEPADVRATAIRVKSELPTFIKQFGAQRIAIDSISLLNMMFPDEVERRTRLFALNGPMLILDGHAFTKLYRATSLPPALRIAMDMLFRSSLPSMTSCRQFQSSMLSVIPRLRVTGL